MGSIYYYPSFSLIQSLVHRCLAPLVSLSYAVSSTAAHLLLDLLPAPKCPDSLQGSPLSLDCGLS